jgi:hypothetical protein
MPLKSGDTFFVSGNAMLINNIRYDPATPANSYITLNNIKHTFSSGALLANASIGFDLNANASLVNNYSNFLGFNNVSMVLPNPIIAQQFTDIDSDQGSKTMTIAVVSDDFNDFNEDVAYILAGADANVTSDYYRLNWQNPFFVPATGAYAAMNNTVMAITYTAATGVPTHLVSYNQTGSYDGISAWNATNVFVNQALEKSSEDRNKYEQLSMANYEATSTNTLAISAFKEDAKLRLQLLPGTTAGAASENAFTVDTTKTFPYDVTSAVTVTDLACVAAPVPTGTTPGIISDDLIVSDDVVPTGNAIVIGGHYVNKRAVSMTEGTLTAAGTKMIELSGKTLYVAGYTAADTTAAVAELIAAIKAL